MADVSDQQLDEVVRLAGVTSARHLHAAAMKARGDNGITRAFTTRPVAQANAIEAVDYFTDLKANGLNVVALNNS